MMKRYMLFAFDEFDSEYMSGPLGGMDDFVNSYDTVEQAITGAEVVNKETYHVYDLRDGVVWRKADVAGHTVDDPSTEWIGVPIDLSYASPEVLANWNEIVRRRAEADINAVKPVTPEPPDPRLTYQRTITGGPEGECESCVDGKCVTGPKCVTLARDS